MAKSIISVGFNIPGYPDTHFELNSNQSLLDYDVIVFNPDISTILVDQPRRHKGKPYFDIDIRREKLERLEAELV